MAATRINLNKLLTEIRGFAEVTYRRPLSHRLVPFLMQLRAQTTRIRLPKQKLQVLVDLQDRRDIPHPVKITHRENNPAVSGTL
jgi:hypothetical protein